MWYTILGTITVSTPETFWDTEGFLYEIFLLWEKKIRRKILIPASSFIPNFFRCKHFSTTQKGSYTNFFGSVRQKNFDGNSWPNPLKQKNFSTPKNTDRLRGSPTKSFDTETINFWRKFLILPPPFLSRKFSDISNFLRHRGVPLRSFSILWRNKFFYRKSWYSLLTHWIFRYLKLFETQKGSSEKFLLQQYFDR